MDVFDLATYTNGKTYMMGKVDNDNDFAIGYLVENGKVLICICVDGAIADFTVTQTPSDLAAYKAARNGTVCDLQDLYDNGNYQTI